MLSYTTKKLLNVLDVSPLLRFIVLNLSDVKTSCAFICYSTNSWDYLLSDPEVASNWQLAISKFSSNPITF